MTLLAFLYKTGKSSYGRYQCDICGKIYRTRIRKRVKDNCGCQGNRYQHGEECGGKKTPELSVHRKMKDRCTNPDSPDWKNYGGRGIKVCDSWLESFSNFLDDMGRKPSKDSTIERLDVNGDYCPTNCIWLPKAEQSKNTRTNVRITIGDEEKILSDWLREYQIPRTSFYKRLRKSNGCHLTALSHWIDLENKQ